MQWIKMTVHTTTECADLVGETLLSAGAEGVQIEDRTDVLSAKKTDGMWDMIDESVLRGMPEDVQVSAYFQAETGEQRFLAEQRVVALRGTEGNWGTLRVETEAVQDEDWQENWKQYYKPLRVGARIVVKPTWEEYDPQEGDLVLEMDPGMAFGTGSHETTSMCIAMLERIIEPGKTCIDVGCGSGILALAAAKLGASRCLAIDLDEAAVRVAKENVAHNGLETTVDVVRGDLLEQNDAKADVVVANIIADVICYLARPVRPHLNENGVFIVSGIIREKEQDVLHALSLAGFDVIDRLEKGEWVCLAASLRG